jgi:hypothetical protein
VRLGRIVLAFRSFFAILFHGALPQGALEALGLAKAAPAAAKAEPAADHSDGAIALLGILQRDARLVDFLLEDVSGYSDEQVGAAVRSLHDQCRDSLVRYVSLAPVIDAVEGVYTSVAALPAAERAALVKFIGNVPAELPQGGTLRHKGWRAEKVTLPAPRHGVRVVAPAEIEIE